MHTTKWGNTYTDEEWSEMQEHFRREDTKATEYFIVRDDRIKKAARFLAREFNDVPTASWQEAIWEQYQYNREPRKIEFTSAEKESRFNAALEWIDSEINDALDAI